MELLDTPRSRYAAMQKLGWKVIPSKIPLRDSSGNKIPEYLEELQAEERAEEEKDYMRRRRDPMTDTPERD